MADQEGEEGVENIDGGGYKQCMKASSYVEIELATWPLVFTENHLGPQEKPSDIKNSE